MQGDREKERERKRKREREREREKDERHEKYNGAKIEGHCQEEGNNATAIASDLVKNFSAIGLAFLTQKPELCIS
ncbi:hypothetical protein T4E_4475 [Trichinella pseudospiralis]|uniref:Uncharacterized protein n=1 Tax=Trichinella pseudospiralis TaxID=6337 RepID=A0A0V0YDT9_TRIPS|nr:hypothetical protein T4E_4475 [Trichinella pseudospiralis]